VDDVVHRVLSGWIAKGIKKAKGKVAAGIDCKTNLCDKVVGRRRRLCAANWARNVGIADAELVVVPRVWGEMLGFDLSPDQNTVWLSQLVNMVGLLTFKV